MRQMNILGTKFFMPRTTAVWGGGLNMPVLEAMTTKGEYNVEKRPLTLTLNDKPTHTGYYNLVRSAWRNDPNEKVFGSPVSNEFEFFNPREFADLCNTAIPHNVDAWTVLGDGDTLITSWALPTQTQIAGDHVTHHMVVENPLFRGKAVTAYTISLRQVCKNGLRANIVDSESRLSVRHANKANMTERLNEWLIQTWEKSQGTALKMSEAFETLARTRVNELQTKWIITEAYPMPERPAKFKTEKAEDMFEHQVATLEQLRNHAIRLFNGEMVGHTEAVKGTAWGVYNAVAELESWRRGRGDSAVSDFLSGERASRIQRAFRASTNLQNAPELTNQLQFA